MTCLLGSSPVESHEPIQKMKRLLCTLVNHVREINPETGEKVAKLVLALVVSFVLIIFFVFPFLIDT